MSPPVNEVHVRKAVIGALLTGLLFGPATCLAGLAMLLNPAAQASCIPGAGLSLGAIPHSLFVTTTDGYTFTLNHQQLTHAATIITVGDRTKGVGREGVVIALMAALTESTLEMLSNTSAYPESPERWRWRRPRLAWSLPDASEHRLGNRR